jgi:hypothetical protein
LSTICWCFFSHFFCSSSYIRCYSSFCHCIITGRSLSLHPYIGRFVAFTLSTRLLLNNLLWKERQDRMKLTR